MGRTRYLAERTFGSIRDTVTHSALGRAARRRRARRRWAGESASIYEGLLRGAGPLGADSAYGAGNAGVAALPSPRARHLAVARNLAVVYVLVALALGGWYVSGKRLAGPALSSVRRAAVAGSVALLSAVELDTSTSRMVLASALPRTDANSQRPASGGLTPGAVKRWVVSSLGLTIAVPRSLMESQLAQPPFDVTVEEAESTPLPRRDSGMPAPSAPVVAPQEAGGPTVKPELPSVLIYHTHTSETYGDQGGAYLWETHAPDTTLPYMWGSSQGVATVGTELAAALGELGVKAYHSQKVHDYPDFTSAYRTALPTVEAMLAEHKDAGMVLDIHRDSLLKGATAATVTVNGETAARVFIVVTTDKFGLPHPNWRRNYAFALKLEKEINGLHPGLCRGVDLRDDARWNQQVSDHAIILEIGSTLNSVPEALTTARLLARPIASVLGS